MNKLFRKFNGISQEIRFLLIVLRDISVLLRSKQINLEEKSVQYKRPVSFRIHTELNLPPSIIKKKFKYFQ
jgi:hypothetical protein